MYSENLLILWMYMF